MEPFIGQIQVFSFNYAPKNWATCDGQLLSIAQNTALYSLIGNDYGGNGTTTFALPDLRGRAMVHRGEGNGLNYVNVGQKGGILSEAMFEFIMPSHSHGVAVTASSDPGEEASPTLILASSPGEYNTSTTPYPDVLGGLTQQNVGAGVPFSLTNPYLGLNISIALQGGFPARN